MTEQALEVASSRLQLHELRLQDRIEADQRELQAIRATREEMRQQLEELRKPKRLCLGCDTRAPSQRDHSCITGEDWWGNRGGDLTPTLARSPENSGGGE